MEFVKPLQGEISKGFSDKELVYSETLEEWSTHNGIDIKANEGEEVVAASSGTVKSIKNDPRYGLTVTIDHEDGYQTIYSNLLNAEQIVEGEKVEKGQAIATVGNSAIFECKDGTHLHFEVKKDSKEVDPMSLIK